MTLYEVIPGRACYVDLQLAQGSKQLHSYSENLLNFDNSCLLQGNCLALYLNPGKTLNLSEILQTLLKSGFLSSKFHMTPNIW